MKHLKFVKLILLTLLLISINNLYSQCLIQNSELENVTTGGIFSSDDDGPHISQGDIASVNGSLFFQAVDAKNGSELWKIDGVTQEVSLVKDIYPGDRYSTPEQITEFNGIAIFSAETDLGRELWVSDGTEQGTFMLKDIWQGSGSSSPSGFKSIGAYLLFSATDQNGYDQLWKTDGTTAGTEIVGIQGVQFSSKFNTACGSDVYYSATNELNGTELWKSDGTVMGTNLVKDIVAGETGSSPGSISCFQDGIVFSAWQDGTGSELWKSNGTAAGTYVIKDINPGSSSSSPHGFVELGNQILFSAESEQYGRELWISDGTSQGTQLLLDLVDGTFSSSPHQFIKSNGKVFFTAKNSVFKLNLWVTDGTASGTNLIIPADSNLQINDPKELLAHGGYLYFVSGDDLWRTDGTETGTINVTRTVPSYDLEALSSLTGIGDDIYFVADDYTHGYEMWKHNINDLSVDLTKDINSSKNGLAFSNLFCTDDELFYLTGTVNSSPPGTFSTLWSTDGNQDGSAEIVIAQGGLHYIKSLIGKIGSDFYFKGGSATKGVELWKSDGSQPRTQIVKDINPGNKNGLPNGSILISNNKIYFNGSDGVHGIEPWISDGTSGGTFLLLDINEGTGNSSPGDFISAESLVYFNAANNGKNLWVTDGTTQGTVQLTESISIIDHGSNQMVSLGSKLIFVAREDINGIEPWVSDGTVEGTKILKDIVPGPDNSNPLQFVVTGDIAHFTLSNSNGEVEIWKTDGTPSGTELVIGNFDIGISDFTVVGDLFFFRGGLSYNTSGLWVSDGTANGSFALTDSYPLNILAAEGGVYFTQKLPGRRNEIWFSDGTSEGTYNVLNSTDCLSSEHLTAVKVWNNDLYYFGTSKYQTRGLHKLNCTQTECKTTFRENKWDGPMVANWNTSPSYWQLGRFPSICDNVVIPSGYEVTVESCQTAVAHTLDVNKGAIFNTIIGAEVEVNLKE